MRDEQSHGLTETLGRFRPASAEALNSAVLEERRETKFVLSSADATALLASAVHDHRLVLADEARIARYDNLYFDTPSFDFYRAHHRGTRPRIKIRIREHRTRGIAYLEIKEKGKDGATRKWRRERPTGMPPLADEERALLAAKMAHILGPKGGDPPALRPSMRIRFDRVMLVRENASERLTLDFNLGMLRAEGYGPDTADTDGGTSAEVVFPRLVVAELKRSGRETVGTLAIPGRSIRSASFSKYCAAVALLEPNLPNHRFRKQLRLLDRLSASRFEGWRHEGHLQADEKAEADEPTGVRLAARG